MLIFGVAFVAYFLSRSPGLDDNDSVQFAMGVRDFIYGSTSHIRLDTHCSSFSVGSEGKFRSESGEFLCILFPVLAERFCGSVVFHYPIAFQPATCVVGRGLSCNNAGGLDDIDQGPDRQPCGRFS